MRWAQTIYVTHLVTLKHIFTSESFAQYENPPLQIIGIVLNNL